MSELKVFGGVETTSRRLLCFAEDSYGILRQQAMRFAPTFVETAVGHAEAVLHPWYDSLQDVAHGALTKMDATACEGLQKTTGLLSNGVNGAKHAAQTGVETAKGIVGPSRFESFVAAKDMVAQRATDAVACYKDNGIMGIGSKVFVAAESKVKSYFAVISSNCESALALVKERGAVGAAKESAGSAVTLIRRKGVDAWLWAVNTPTGQKVEKVGANYAGAIKEYYMAVHDRVVASDRYSMLYSSVTDLWSTYVIGNAKVTKPLGQLHASLYPYVKFAADPAVDMSKPYVTALQQHMEPLNGSNGPPATTPDHLPAYEASVE